MSLALVALGPALLDKRMKNVACATLGKLARSRERRQNSFFLVFLAVASVRHCTKVLLSKREALGKDLHPARLSGKRCIPWHEEGSSAPIGAASLRGGSNGRGNLRMRTSSLQVGRAISSKECLG